MRYLLVLLLIGACSAPVQESVSYGEKVVMVEEGDNYTLTAGKFTREYGAGTVDGFAYNGQVPGPLLIAKQGSSFTVLFQNALDVPSTIHWHGLRHENRFDGVPDVTQDAVVPGADFAYTVRVPDDGMFWYHPHVREDMQQDLGLYGNLLVIPEDELEVNRADVLVLDDMLSRESHHPRFASHALMGRFGDVMLVNGRSDLVSTAKRGEVVRYYITNVANTRVFNISFEGARMKLVGSDLSSYEQEVFVDSVVIAPAERYVLDVYFEGESKLVHVSPLRSYVLMNVSVSDSVQKDYSQGFSQLRSDIALKEEIAKFLQHEDKPLDYVVNLTLGFSGMMAMHVGHMMGPMSDHMMDGQMQQMHDASIEWEDAMPMMNAMATSENTHWKLQDAVSGSENMEFMMKAKVGDVLKIRLFNDPNSAHPMQHPIHLHGQRFLVTHVDGVKQENLAWKDTVLVPAGSAVDILVDVSNPGDWMLHCHIAEHLTSGMMAMLRVE